MATGTVRPMSNGSNGQPVLDTPLEIQLTEEQAEFLERQFLKTKNPHPSEILLTAAEVGLSEDDVKNWFARRMALWRRDQGLNPVRSRIC